MSKTNTLENELLLLLFNNTNIALVGDATGLRGSTTAGSLYISLHTADPGEAGAQNTSETAYGGYARLALPRTAMGGWNVIGNAVANSSTATFPTCSSGSSTITHFGIGTDASGAGKLLYKGALTSSLAVSTGVVPTFNSGQLTVTED